MIRSLARWNGICPKDVRLPPESLVVGCLALLLSACLTGWVRRLAVAHGVLDVPNERSSHAIATPRGGGIAIVVSSCFAWAILAVLGHLEWRLFWGLVGGGVIVAAVGFIDDRRPVRAGVRLAVHATAAVWALIWVGGLPAMRFGAGVVELGWLGDVLAVLGIVWTLNLFNFMDGIDGIAVSEAIFIAAGGALLALLGGLGADVPVAGLVFSAACGGFLFWNWPPAKIFMGDVGSGYLGYVIAVLGLACAQAEPAAVWVWLALGAAFFVDSTVTLIRRALRHEAMHAAHRSHAYQWLARRWQSHRQVTLLVILLDVLWLLPCALIAAVRTELAFWVVCLALTPLVILALAAGAGRQEIA